MNVDVRFCLCFWVEILVLTENLILIAVLNHPSIVPRVSRTKPNTSKYLQVRLVWGRSKQYHLSIAGCFFKMRGGTLCMLERISLKVGSYESTGYQRVPQIPGWWQFGRDDFVGNFFLEAKRSAFMIHQPAMCDQATTKGMRCSVYTCILRFL